MKIELRIGDKNINVNGECIQMDTSPFIKDDRAFVPIRFVSEALKQNVLWDDATNTITIYDRKTRFKTMNECAIDFYMYWNAMSIGILREIGATMKKDKNGYYWDEVFVGKYASISAYKFNIKDGVAILHTHGGVNGADYFSKNDINLANKYSMPIYMASPLGNCWVYDPLNKNADKIYDGVPTDLRDCKRYEKYDMKRNVQRFNDYFPKYHELKDEPLGYVADYYNKLYSQGKCYTLRVDADDEGEIIV